MQRRLTRIGSFLALAAFAASPLAAEPRSHELRAILSYGPLGSADNAGSCVDDRCEFDFKGGTPLQFLEFLKQGGSCTFDCHHEGWILESDLPRIVDLLDSTEPCASVSMSISSLHLESGSTVGQEAAFLIEGFRTGYYPPDLNSNRRERGFSELMALRSWYVKEYGRGPR